MIIERPLKRVEYLAPIFGGFLEQLGVANSLFGTACGQPTARIAGPRNLQLLR